MNHKVASLSLLIGLALVGFSGANAATPAQQAMSDYSAGHYPIALKEFVDLEKQYPNNATVHYYAGLCRQAMGQISEARVEYQWVCGHDAGKLKGFAQAGLNNLDKYSSHSSGSSDVGAAAAPAATASAKGGGGEEFDLKNLPPNMSPAVQKAIEAAKKNGYSIGKNGKIVMPGKDQSANGASGSGAAGAASGAPTSGVGGNGPKVAAKPKVKKIFEFCTTNDRSCIAFDETFTGTQKQFSDIQFVKMNVDEGNNASVAAKYNVSAYPTLVYLDASDKVLENSMGAPMGDSFAEKIKSLNGESH